MAIKTVVLDAGHGGSDPGAVLGNRYESNDVLKLAKVVKQLLTSQSIDVVMTRTTDAKVELATRTSIANKAGADLFVSLHRNSWTDASAKGTEIWIFTTAGAVDETAAGAVLEKLVKVGIQSNRGVKKGNYHVLRESNMTSMLVELGFISNTIDNQLFDKHLNAYAEAIAKGICESLGVTWNQEKPKQYARIQLGAYTYPENESGARNVLEAIRQLGRERGVQELAEAWLVLPSSEQVEPQ